MAYIKNTWVDQDVARPKTYQVTENQDGSITLTDDFGLITELGTPVDQDHMNHIEEGIEGVDVKVGELSSLNTTDKTSIVNAINSVQLLENDRLHALKGYEDAGELLTDEEGLADVTYYAHSTFDLSKFTVVGSPTITNDGIASGFSSSNYLQAVNVFNQIITPNTFEIKIKFGITSGAGALISNYVYDGTQTYGIGVQTNGTNAINFYIGSANGSTNWDITNGAKPIYYNDLSNPIDTNNINLIFGYDGTKYYAKIGNNNPITLATTTTKTGLNKTFGIGYNSSFGALSNSTSVDLKQFSITVDGVEVFNGNKTGIDTIKPDNYTVVGTPTISADGVASGFNTTNWLTETLTSFEPSQNWKIHYRILTPSSLPSSGNYYMIGSIGSSSNRAYIRYGSVSFGLELYRSGDSSTTLSFRDDPPPFNTWCDIEVGQEKSGETIKTYIRYKRAEESDSSYVEKSSTTSSALLIPTSNIVYIGNWYNYSTQNFPYSGSIDLNSFKIYVDGDLVYQPCLKIPYTQSKTGSKVVDSTYRDRVNDMYEQFGYAPFYTLLENKKGNYTVVGSPTISGDYVASGFSYTNYIKTTVSSFDKTKPFEILSPIFEETTIDGDLHYVYQTWGTGGAEGLRVYVQRYKVGCRYKLEGQSSYTSMETDNVVVAGNKYQIKVTFTGTEYQFKYRNITTNSEWSNIGTGTVSSSTALANDNKNFYIGYHDSNPYGFINGSIDLKQFKIYVDNKLAYEAVTDPNFTIPQGEIYGRFEDKWHIVNQNVNNSTSASSAGTTTAVNFAQYIENADNSTYECLFKYFVTTKSGTSNVYYTVFDETNNITYLKATIDSNSTSDTRPRGGQFIAILKPTDVLKLTIKGSYNLYTGSTEDSTEGITLLAYRKIRG